MAKRRCRNGKIRKKLEKIEDTRPPSYVEHKLANILIIIMCAVLCGIDELSEIVGYAKNKREFLKNRFGIKNIPSKPTFSRVLHMIDGAKVATIIIEIMKENVENLAIDGKAIRSTSKKGNPHSVLQIVTAYFTESGAVSGRESIHEKMNEIPVFQGMMDISGKTITADAMHCQKETCKKILAKGGNYVFGLKENQKSLHDDVELFLSDKINAESMKIYSVTNKNSGRIEKRTCYKTSDIEWLSKKSEWSGLTSIFAVKHEITTKYGTSEEMSYINLTTKTLMQPS